MVSNKFLVIYYDGNQTQTKLVSTYAPEEIWLEHIQRSADGNITAIIQMPFNTEALQVTERDDLTLLVYSQQEALVGDVKAIFVEDL